MRSGCPGTRIYEVSRSGDTHLDLGKRNGVLYSDIIVWEIFAVWEVLKDPGNVPAGTTMLSVSFSTTRQRNGHQSSTHDLSLQLPRAPSDTDK